MAETLTSAVDRKWESRLQNWALWYVGHSSENNYPASSSGTTMGDLGRARGGGQTWEDYSGVPAIVGAALDTNQLVLRLDARLFGAVKAWYVWTGEIEQRAKDAGCSERTLYRRVDEAKIDLERLDGERKRGEVRYAPAIVMRTTSVPDDWRD